ncbi:unnamed protein product [Mytilus coruscus]|uniref:Uncharacterized protein n=1 Tax=Mytilus coruscus TaxID=42192 RepID=A0A6J8B2L7_MYTCO|nr:unnamed protein product [Mytilus coruscus]
MPLFLGNENIAHEPNVNIVHGSDSSSDEKPSTEGSTQRFSATPLSRQSADFHYETVLPQVESNLGIMASTSAQESDERGIQEEPDTCRDSRDQCCINKVESIENLGFYTCPKSGKRERTCVQSQTDRKCPAKNCPVVVDRRDVKRHSFEEHLSEIFQTYHSTRLMKDSRFHQHRAYVVMLIRQETVTAKELEERTIVMDEKEEIHYESESLNFNYTDTSSKKRKLQSSIADNDKYAHHTSENETAILLGHQVSQLAESQVEPSSSQLKSIQSPQVPIVVVIQYEGLQCMARVSSMKELYNVVTECFPESGNVSLICEGTVLDDSVCFDLLGHRPHIEYKGVSQACHEGTGTAPRDPKGYMTQGSQLGTLSLYFECIPLLLRHEQGKEPIDLGPDEAEKRNPGEFWKVRYTLKPNRNADPSSNITHQEWFEYFKKLMNVNQKDNFSNDNKVIDQFNSNILNYDITTEEVILALKSLTNKKACGADGVRNEMIKISCSVNIDMYVKYLILHLNLGFIPLV